MKRLFILVETIIVLFVLVIISGAGVISKSDSINSIEVAADSVQDAYYFNDFDLSKIYLIINNNDGTTEKVALTREMVDQEDIAQLSSVGQHNIKVKYGNKKIDISITIIDNRVDVLLKFVYSKQQTDISYIEWKNKLSKNKKIVAASINKDGDLIITLVNNEIINTGKAFGNNQSSPSTPSETVEQVEITLNANGGYYLGSKVLKTKKGTSITLPLITKTGYNFLGWYNGDVLYTSDTIINSNVTLDAKWKIKTYLVEFIDITNNQVINSQMVNHGSLPIVPFVYKEYYTFINFDPSISVITENTTIYVIYVANKFALIFNTNGGDTIDPLTLNENTTISDLPIPVKEGYTFKGWYLDTNYSQKVSLPFAIRANTYLFAKWEN